MAMTHSVTSRRRIDFASLALMLTGIASGLGSYWLVTEAGLNALILVPSVVAATLGASHLVQRVAPRE